MENFFVARVGSQAVASVRRRLIARFLSPLRMPTLGAVTVLALAAVVWLHGGPAFAGTATATILDVSPSPSVVNHEVTLTATIMDTSSTPVVASGATGTVTFTATGLGTLGTSPLSGGTATLAHTFLAGDVGVKVVQAVYSGDGSFDGSGANPFQHQTFAVPANAIGSSLNPSGLGQAVTFTSIVAGFGSAPTGTVTFKDGPDTLGAVNVSTVGTGQPLMVGGVYACALSNSRAKCWGSNQSGELGSSSNAGVTVTNPPADVNALSTAVRPVAISGKGGHTCVLISNGDVKCWGGNRFGELGLGFASVNPDSPSTGAFFAAIGSVTGATAVAAGGAFTCILTRADGVKCWGSNGLGQLGVSTNFGTLNDNPMPLDVTGLTSGVVAISAGYEHACALTSAGVVKCWGGGDPTVVDVSGLSSVVAISAGGGHTCAVTSAGGVKCWGDNSYGQLGAADANGMVDGLSNDVVAIAAAVRSTCALTSGGGVKCWGNGDPTPADVPNLTSGVTAIAAGGNTGVGCAVTSAGAVQCWGDNSMGQLGIDPSSVSSSSTPLTIPTMGAGSAMVFGKATYTTSALALGDHSIVATYQTDNPGLEDNVTPALTQTVNKVEQTISFTTSAPAGAVFGGSYTAAATATSGLTVTLGASGACSYSGGAVHFNAVGSCTVTADQAGDSIYNAAPQATQSFNVAEGATTLTASATPTKVKPGQQVTLKGTVHVTSPASATATGQVTFKDSGVTIGIGTVSAGVARFTVTPVSIGQHTITAQYSGDSHLTGSSATATFTVSAANGAESKVNTTTAGSQQSPAVARLKAGYLIAWASNGQDSSGYGVYAQRYTAAGAKAGAELRVNTTTAGNQMLPAAAGLANGTFVVIWQSQAQDKSGFGIYGQRFSAAGAKVGAEFRVNTLIAKDQSLPSIAALSDGGFLVAWTSNGQDGSGLGIYAQRYKANGAKVGAEFKVNKTTVGAQTNSAVAGLSGGGSVVAWQGPDASGLGVYAQRYDSTGKAAGAELRVNSVTAHDQSMPSVAALDNGGFVIAWQSALQDGSALGVYMQRYTSAGVKSGGAVRVNTMTANDQGAPAVAAFSNGGYIVAWTSNLQDGSGQGVYAQAFTDAGAKANVEFRVNTTTGGHQNQPGAAAFASGSCAVVWTSANDGNGQGIYSQRFLIPGTHLNTLATSADTDPDTKY